MTISVGDCIPNCTLSVMGEAGPAPVTTAELFNGKKALLFAVPGAFTPGCSMTHLPGYVANADTIKNHGVDSIICMSVNDAFVMGAWGQAQNAEHIICWPTVTANSLPHWALNSMVPVLGWALAVSALP